MIENEIIEKEIRVIGICGSLREKSYTRMTLKIALEGAKSVGASTKLIDLRDFNLVFCDGRESRYPEDVLTLRQEVKKAHGIIIGSPEYHGSYSGVLKNALDLMGFKEFQSKMIGLIGVAGGSIGALNALNGLRGIGRQLRAWVIPEQVSIPQAWKQFDNNGHLIDSNLEERVKHVGRQVTRFSYLHNSDKAFEFLKMWENAQKNPGGDF
ncbi:MAG: NADPH-dependent FMN reductase [Candidatus Hodarchaeales archaeon]|jgi:NAD(P)H-dependent FMN reductase